MQIVVVLLLLLLFIHNVIGDVPNAQHYRTLQQRVLMGRLRSAFTSRRKAGNTDDDASSSSVRFADSEGGGSATTRSEALIRNRNFLATRAKYHARSHAETAAGAPVELYWDSSNQPGWMTPPWVVNSFRLGPLAYPMPDEGNFEAGPMYLAVPPQPLVPFESQQPADNQPISGYFHNYPDGAVADTRIMSYGTVPPPRALTVLPADFGGGGGGGED